MLLKRVDLVLRRGQGPRGQGRGVRGLRRDAVDPWLAVRYEEGADEIVFLDITRRTSGARRRQRSRRCADDVFIPFTIGGGVRSVADAQAVLDAGATRCP